MARSNAVAEVVLSKELFGTTFRLTVPASWRTFFAAQDASTVSSETSPELRIQRRALQPPADAELWYRGRRFCPYSAGDEVWLVTTGGGAVAHVEPQRGRATVGVTDLAEDDGTAVGNLCDAAAVHLLRGRGVYVVHGGCVCLRAEGPGAVVLGDAGSGKSTLTAALVREGLYYLSDDVIAITRRAALIRAYGDRHWFGLDRGAEAMLGGFVREAAVAQDQRDEGKIRWDPEVLFPGRFVTQCVPRVLLFPEIVPGPSSFEPVPRRDAFVRVARATHHSAFGPRQLVVQQLGVIRDLVEQSACYRVASGPNLASFAHELVNLLPSEN